MCDDCWLPELASSPSTSRPSAVVIDLSVVCVDLLKLRMLCVTPLALGMAAMTGFTAPALLLLIAFWSVMTLELLSVDC